MLDALKVMMVGLGKAFNDFTKYGIKLGKIVEEDGIRKMPLTTKDNKQFQIKWKHTSPSKMKVMVTDGKDSLKRANIPATEDTWENQLKNAVEDMLDEGWGISWKDTEFHDDNEYVTVDENGNIINECKKMSVTLQRVCSATEDSINLVRVYGNYNEKDMQSDIETLLDNEDMLSQITEEPVSFEVTDDGDELDVNPVEMSETECISVSLTNILSCAFKTLHNLQAIHWNAKGDKFEEIHRGSDSCIWNIRSQIDTLAELCVELTGSVSHPALLCSTDSSLNTQSGFEGQEALQMIHSDMSEYIYCLEFYLPNFKDDVQNMMNMWIRDMRHMMDYQLGRSVDTNIAPVPALI